LFSGIGGFALAASWVWGQQHEIHSFVEIEPFAQKVLKKHWPDVPIHEDVTTYEHDGSSIDIISGGFPCQDLSSNGKHLGFEGERSSLYGEILRICHDVRPKYVVMENVPNLLIGGGGEGFGRFLRDLAQSGYDAEWESISAASFGFNHIRDRIFIVAHPTSVRWSTVKFQNRVSSTHKRLSREYSSPSNQKTRRISKADITTEVDGIPNFLDQLKGYGNAIVPQAVVPIFEAIKLIEEQNSD